MNTTIHEIGLDDCCRTEILSAEALDFVAELPERFGARRRELLAVREERQQALLAGGTLDFLPVLNSGARGFMARCACAPRLQCLTDFAGSRRPARGDHRSARW